MKQKLLIAVALIAMTAAGINAQEENGQLSGGERGACKADIQSLCKGDKKGDKKEVIPCLMNHVNQIQNATCKSRIETLKANDNAVKQACPADISKDKCTGMDIGTGLLKCLARNRKTLSDGCKAELKSLRGEYRGNKGGHGQQGKQNGQGSNNNSDNSAGQ